MKRSPYITWAKGNHDVAYSLAGSGMKAPSLKDLINDPLEILESGHHEDGWLPLMECIANRYEVNTKQVVTVHGASLANHVVCALLLEPGDEVMIEFPAYEPLVLLPEYFHATVKRFDRNADRFWQPDPEEIEQKITGNTRLIILTDLHNPTGALLEPEILKNLIQLAEQYQIYILIDEVYLEFLHPEGKRTSARLSPRIITTSSLTKAYGLDDIRVGWILAEAELAERIRRLNDLFVTTLSFPSERLAGAALAQADEMLSQNLSLLQSNLHLVDNFIDNHSELSWIPPRTGSVGFVRLTNGNVDELVGVAREKYQTLVAPGRFFGLPDHFRIGWGMDEERLLEGLRRLGLALEEV